MNKTIRQHKKIHETSFIAGILCSVGFMFVFFLLLAFWMDFLRFDFTNGIICQIDTYLGDTENVTYVVDYYVNNRKEQFSFEGPAGLYRIEHTVPVIYFKDASYLGELDTGSKAGTVISLSIVDVLLLFFTLILFAVSRHYSPSKSLLDAFRKTGQ